VLRIVINGLVRDPQRRRRGQRFPASQIAGKAGMRAAGYLDTHPLAAAEAISGRPEVDLDA
jgi:hypothetical protein